MREGVCRGAGDDDGAYVVDERGGERMAGKRGRGRREGRLSVWALGV